MKTRRRWAAGSALLLVALLLLLFRKERAAPPVEQVARIRTTDGKKPPKFVATPSQSATNGIAPVIDSVKVDKTEVCSGEENFVEIEAHTKDGTDAHLRYQMLGQDSAGPRIPFRLFLGAEQGPLPDVVVQGKTVLARAKLPHITVRDCSPPLRVDIAVTLMPNTWGLYELVAQVSVPPQRSRGQGASGSQVEASKPFVATRYEWELGNGINLTSSTRRIEHSFEDRPQRTRFSYFLLKVKAFAQDGRVVEGSHGLELHNRAFETRETKKLVMLFAELTPRFPVMQADGLVVQGVRLYHAEDTAVQIDRVRLNIHSDIGGQETSQVIEADPAWVLGSTKIPPGRGLETRLVLDTNKQPQVKMLTFNLRGHSNDGLGVEGNISVMRPTPVPTAANHRSQSTTRTLRQRSAQLRRSWGNPRCRAQIWRGSARRVGCRQPSQSPALPRHLETPRTAGLKDCGADPGLDQDRFAERRGDRNAPSESPSFPLVAAGTKPLRGQRQLHFGQQISGGHLSRGVHVNS